MERTIMFWEKAREVVEDFVDRKNVTDEILEANLREMMMKVDKAILDGEDVSDHLEVLVKILDPTSPYYKNMYGNRANVDPDEIATIKNVHYYLSETHSEALKEEYARRRFLSPDTNENADEEQEQRLPNPTDSEIKANYGY